MERVTFGVMTGCKCLPGAIEAPAAAMVVFILDRHCADWRGNVVMAFEKLKFPMVVLTTSMVVTPFTLTGREI